MVATNADLADMIRRPEDSTEGPATADLSQAPTHNPIFETGDDK